ncbi:8181_t:CDS:2, partial [Racocetra persica]
SKNSYLYTDSYEPIVYRTFGVDQSNWNIIALRIKDIFDGIMARCRGFGYPDYDGKKQIDLFKARIAGESPLILPSHTPITPAITNKKTAKKEIIEKKWTKFFKDLHLKKKQSQTNID